MTKYLPNEAMPVDAIQFRRDGDFIDELKTIFPKGDYTLSIRFFGESVTFPVKFSINYNGEDYNFVVSEAGAYLVVKPDELLLLSEESFMEDYSEVEKTKSTYIMPPVIPSPQWPPFNPNQPWITYNESTQEGFLR